MTNNELQSYLRHKENKVATGEIMTESYQHADLPVTQTTEESNKRFSEYLYNWMENNTKD